MLPEIPPFAVMESPATVTIGVAGYPANVIYLPPGRSVSPSGVSAGTHPNTVVDDSVRIDVRKDQVPTLSEGATITGSMDGRPSRTYRVTRVESHDPQYHWCWVR